MMVALVVLSILLIGVGFALGFGNVGHGGSMVAYLAGIGCMLLGSGLVVFTSAKYDDKPLRCETLFETMVQVGDVEICVPTPDAMDLVERYQNG